MKFSTKMEKLNCHKMINYFILITITYKELTMIVNKHVRILKNYQKLKEDTILEVKIYKILIFA